MYTVFIPLKTVSSTNLDSHEHWSKRAKRSKSQRQLAHAWVTNGWSMPDGKFQRLFEKPPPLPIDVLLTRISPREVDDDNLRGALKAVRDGVADAYGVSDRDRSVIRFHYDWRRGKPNEYAVVIDISARKADQVQKGA